MLVTTIAGAILAGGKNTRMGGRNKAFLQINDTPVIHRTINIFKKIFKEIFIVTNSPDDYKLFRHDCNIITDIIKDVGPLGGIHSALSSSSKEAIFFVACDMPFLHNEMILREIKQFNKLQCDALIPKLGGRVEPLHGIYKKVLRDSIDSYMRNNNDYSVIKYLATINACYMDIEKDSLHEHIFCNINSPDDLNRARGLDENKIKSMA